MQSMSQQKKEDSWKGCVFGGLEWIFINLLKSKKKKKKKKKYHMKDRFLYVIEPNSIFEKFHIPNYKYFIAL